MADWRSSDPEIKIGVPACLLGEAVRYGGGHKRDAFVADTLLLSDRNRRPSLLWSRGCTAWHAHPNHRQCSTRVVSNGPLAYHRARRGTKRVARAVRTRTGSKRASAGSRPRGSAVRRQRESTTARRGVSELLDLFGADPLHPARLVPERPAYRTTLGAVYLGDSVQLLAAMPPDSVDLVVTSPPYALHFQKEYGNVSKEAYVDWFRPFGKAILRVLKPSGSFVLNIGGSYNAGSPTRSMYHFHVLLMLCEELGYHLAQECFWYNPAKLPSPAEWVNVRRVRIKDSVEYVWWLSKEPMPKADNRKVLSEYSADMRRLLTKGYRAKQRPSGHRITTKFADRGGSIPSNVLERGNNESNSRYIRLCAEHGLNPHPARFPSALPEFFIRFLTDPHDVVLDPFAGSNTTGAVAEHLVRRWLAFEIEPRYVQASRLRFPSSDEESGASLIKNTGLHGVTGYLERGLV